MDITELESKLNTLGISEGLYSIMKGDLPNEKLCIVHEEACKYFLKDKTLFLNIVLNS